MPRLDKDRQDRLVPIPGTPPSLINVPQGCAFNPRCAYGHLNNGRSETERPLLVETEPGHQVACHLSNAQQRQIWLEDIAPRL
jgi:peptide/nickel transport system ATP-binding protein